MERKHASEFPQELLDIFHLYQHGEIDRRTFLDRAGHFAVGGLTAVGILELLRPHYAWAQQVPKDDARIRTEVATVASPQGNGSIRGLLARPAAAGRYPAVLVVHENRGLNPYVEDVARRFAVANFVAFAPDGLTSPYRKPESCCASSYRTTERACRRICGARSESRVRSPPGSPTSPAASRSHATGRASPC